MSGHHAVMVRTPEEVKLYLERLGTDPGGYPYLVPKALFQCILLKGVKARAGNIIKQEMLSKGGDAAVSRDALSGEGETDVLLMGTLKQYRLLIKKMKLQPFGLKGLATEIEAILSNLVSTPRVLPLAHGQSLSWGERTLVMGILNVTPDSFSDGGRYHEADHAVRRALEMVEQGADLIDVGGASSRPQARIASQEEELLRILPVIERLVKERIVLSVDTFRGHVARAALEAGAHLINDIGRLQMDSQLLPVLVEHQAPVVLMHNRLQIQTGQPYTDLISDIVDELDQSVQQAVAAGLDRDRIIIDPGIGFGKDAAQNRLIIKHLQEFKSLGRPVLLGASRKSFIGHTLQLEAEERLEASVAVAVMGAMHGADLVRVHDVRETVRAVRMADAVRMENG